MNFFGMGPQEILLIAVLALVVVGPKQLPALLKQMGGWFGKAKDLQREFQRGVDDIVRESELDGVAKTVNQVRSFTPAAAATSLLNSEVAKAEGTDSSSSSSRPGATNATSSAEKVSKAPEANQFVTPAENGVGASAVPSIPDIAPGRGAGAGAGADKTEDKA